MQPKDCQPTFREESSGEEHDVKIFPDPIVTLYKTNNK